MNTLKRNRGRALKGVWHDTVAENCHISIGSYFDWDLKKPMIKMRIYSQSVPEHFITIDEGSAFEMLIQLSKSLFDNHSVNEKAQEKKEQK